MERKATTRFLGIDIDCNLTWDTHFNNVISSVAKTIGILYKVKQFVPNHILILLYNSLILSRLLYCNVAWGRSSKRNIDSILLLQKKAVRICSGSHFLANTDPLFKKLRLLKITDITLMQTALFMYKLSKGQVPPYFSTIFQKNKSIHLYNTRNSENFHLINPRTTIAQRSIRHTGPDIWHSLPVEIKNRTFISSFKTTLKNYLLTQYNTQST